MMKNKQVLIFGATGNVGGAAARELLQRGWRVRGVTRNPQSEKAQALARLGAEVVHGDMNNRAAIAPAFAGSTHVVSIQNWMIDGPESEIRQGKLVAELAHAAGVEHLAYLSAGSGDPHTGVPHFDSKLKVEAYMRSLGLPFTILRPTPFMELLTNKEFFPPLAVWGAQIKIVGWEAAIPWVSVRDIGAAIANCFEAPETWLGSDVTLIGDVQSMRQCRQIFIEVDGKSPLRLPLPLALFQKLAGEEMVLMWRWLKDYLAQHDQAELWQLAESSRALCPEMLTIESWLRSIHAEQKRQQLQPAS